MNSPELPAESPGPSEPAGSKRIFTTGEAAAVCKVSQQTIIRCFDAGRLTGFRVPGSKFRRIPRDELLRFMRASGIPTDALESAPSPAPACRRVLIVDDDPAFLRLAEHALTRAGFEVRTASTGYDAGLLTESFRPHIVLLDFMLPDINGNVVCTRIRAKPELKGTKILCISGVVKPEDIDSLKQAGADDFLKKPFGIAALVQRIETLLELEARNSGRIQGHGPSAAAA